MRGAGTFPDARGHARGDDLDAEEGLPVHITIDRGDFTLRVYQNLKLARSYTIAVGQQGLETPAGIYSVQDKQVNPWWHVPKARGPEAWPARLSRPGLLIR